MAEIICVKNVSKKFGAQTVLEDVSLTCEAGKIYGIIGYNGSGKSVLFKCICGLYHADTGEIHIREKQLGKDMDMIENAGVIIEEPAFLKQYSGLRNLELLWLLNNKKDSKKLQDVMRTVGLDPANRKPVGKYSLGMKQRLAIAQAIMEEQDILILDEPMNGLDKDGVAQMRELFLRFKEEGKTLLFASHNAQDIDVLCDEVYEMDKGRLERIR
ncbi:MAG: ATP-binding cassette domain-containing protein [Lachnospiraceae bacterium]|nr:ATP-binding cassette domain-containing protein [Lachnospiraceae bacterium]